MSHVENFTIEGKRLGRRAPSNKPALHLSSILKTTVPVHPASVTRSNLVADWGLYGNNEFGDCGPVSVANYDKLVTKVLTGTEFSVTLNDVFDLYRRSGNPNFNPTTDADDNGVELQTMLSALLAGGIGGRKPVAFAKVDVSNLDEVRAAIDIFGGLLLGVNLQEAQQAQTNNGGPWDYLNSSEWGGHAVVAVDYSSKPTGTDVAVITWGMVMGTTDAFWTHQVEEAWVVIWPEHFGKASFDQNIDVAALEAAYKSLTGQNLNPPAPSPQPSPTPPPTPAPTPKPEPGQWAKLITEIKTAIAELENDIKKFFG